jgi:hypothetical protein
VLATWLRRGRRLDGDRADLGAPATSRARSTGSKRWRASDDAVHAAGAEQDVRPLTRRGSSASSRTSVGCGHPRRTRRACRRGSWFRSAHILRPLSAE